MHFLVIPSVTEIRPPAALRRKRDYRNNVIAIGTTGQNVSNSCFIGHIYSNIQPQVGTDPDLVTINSDGRLGRANVSSRRYKHDIQPMHTASEAIYAT